MKRLIISLCLLAICIGTGIFSTNFVNQKCIDALDGINYAVALKDDIPAAQAIIENTHADWNKSSNLLCLLVNKRDILEVESELNTLLFYINTNNIEAFILAAPECTNKITNVLYVNQLSFENIL